MNRVLFRAYRALRAMLDRLKHNRDTTGDFGSRVLLHIPIGLLLGVPLLGLPLLYLFRAYEENEDLHTKDEAWKDYFGAMVGCTITILCMLVLVWRLSC